MITVVGYSVLLLISFYLLTLIVDYFLTPTIYGLKYLYKRSDDKMGTALSFVSSSPEMSLSLVAIVMAAYRGGDVGSIGPSTVVGSGLFSILFLVGLSGRYIQKPLNPSSIIRDCSYYVFVTLIMFWFVSDGWVTLMEAMILLGLFVIYFIAIQRREHWMRAIGVAVAEIDYEEGTEDFFVSIPDLPRNWSNSIVKMLNVAFFDLTKHNSLGHIVWNMILAAVIIMGLNTLMVQSAVYIAEYASIPSAIIALTILAAGTSIPDVLTSLKPAQEGFGDAAMVNAIGSNIFDMLFNLGVSWMLGSLLFMQGGAVAIDVKNIDESIVVLIVSTLLVLVLCRARKRYLGKTASAFLMLCYVLYIVYQCLMALGLLDHFVAV